MQNVISPNKLISIIFKEKLNILPLIYGITCRLNDEFI